MFIENKDLINLLLCRYYFYSGIILLILPMRTGIGVNVRGFVGVEETEEEVGEKEAEVEDV